MASVQKPSNTRGRRNRGRGGRTPAAPVGPLPLEYRAVNFNQVLGALTTSDRPVRVQHLGIGRESVDDECNWASYPQGTAQVIFVYINGHEADYAAVVDDKGACRVLALSRAAQDPKDATLPYRVPEAELPRDFFPATRTARG